MTQMSHASQSAAAPARSRLVQIGLAVAGIVSVASGLLSAATIYLVVLHPVAVVQALVERQPEVPLQAVVSVVMAVLASLVGGA